LLGAFDLAIKPNSDVARRATLDQQPTSLMTLLLLRFKLDTSFLK
jgi:hypothetical protein